MNPSTASEVPTSGQKEEVVRLITDAVRKGAGSAWDELVGRRVLTRLSVERIRARGGEVAAAVLFASKQKMAELAENISGCLRLISGAEEIILQTTDGKATIAEATDVFNHIDSDFRNWDTDVESEPTGPTAVAVHEMVKDGDFRQIFGGLSDDLDSRCLTQGQIVSFVRNHRRWLRTDGYATFFLFKVGNEFFVVRVYLDDDGWLEVCVCRFSFYFVWHAEYRLRVVVPATGT